VEQLSGTSSQLKFDLNFLPHKASLNSPIRDRLEGASRSHSPKVQTFLILGVFKCCSISCLTLSTGAPTRNSR
jgi:hypothetical protein